VQSLKKHIAASQLKDSFQSKLQSPRGQQSAEAAFSIPEIEYHIGSAALGPPHAHGGEIGFAFH